MKPTSIVLLLFSLTLAMTGEDVLRGRALNGSYRLYRGPALPSDQVAILEAPPRSELTLQSIDGMQGPDKKAGYNSTSTGAFHLELPAGPHALIFTYFTSWADSAGATYTYNGGRTMILFVAEPGTLYKAEAAQGLRAWSLGIGGAGDIPKDYPRPTNSCESFSKERGGCLAASQSVRARAPRAQARVRVRGEMSLGGATFAVEGDDVDLIFAAKGILTRAVEGLNLSDEADQRRFLPRYWKERRERPELDKIAIASKEFRLVEPPATAPVSAPAPGRSEDARGEMEAVLMAQASLRSQTTSRDYRARSDAADAAVDALNAWADRKLSPDNALTVAEVFALALPDLYDIGLRYPDGYLRLWKVIGTGRKIGEATVLDNDNGRPTSTCMFKVGQNVVGAYVKLERDGFGWLRANRASLRSAWLRRDDLGEVAVAKPGFEAKGSARMVVFSPELDAPSAESLLSKAFSLDAIKDTQWPYSRHGSYTRSQGWVLSPKGDRVANLNPAPAGGYLVANREGVVKAVLGYDLKEPRTETLPEFKDEQGNLFLVPVTANTYQGRDGRTYSLALAETNEIVMHGVWADGATPSAAGFKDPALFRVLFTRK